MISPERFRQLQQQERQFEKKCAIAGLAVVATSIAAITTGSVRQTFYPPTETRVEDERNVRAYDPNNERQTYWDDLNIALIGGGIIGVAVGTQIVVLPGTQVKMRMGL